MVPTVPPKEPYRRRPCEGGSVRDLRCMPRARGNLGGVPFFLLLFIYLLFIYYYDYTWLLNMQFGRRDDSPNHTLWCRSHNNPMLWPSTGGVQTIVRWIPLFSLLTYLLTLHTTNRHRQSNLKFTMLLSLNYINETMYYWGVNSKMQTSHTLCSRPKRYGALQVMVQRY